MIDFPATPTAGQIYNSGTGPIYIWDGVAWSLVTQATRTARQNNLIVNPAMQVSQENGATAVNTSGAFPADQWQAGFGGPVCSVQQVVGYTPDLSVNRIRKTVTTPKASLAAGDISYLIQSIEGLRVASLGFGSAVAIQSVLRFGYKGPAGTYSISISNGTTGTRSYVKNFTISAAQANTDTLQVFTIPPDTTGTWATDNTNAMIFAVTDAVGTTLQGVEGWQAGGKYGTAANSNMVATNGNVVELFDVGLYPDPEKTGLPPPFIAPIYAQALLDCQRYWEPVPAQVYTWAANQSGISNGQTMITKRINPTLAITNLGQTGNAGGYPQVSAWQTSKFSMTMAASASNQWVTASMIVNANARM